MQVEENMSSIGVYACRRSHKVISDAISGGGGGGMVESPPRERPVSEHTWRYTFVGWLVVRSTEVRESMIYGQFYLDGDGGN